jgi:hypothetical protein
MKKIGLIKYLAVFLVTGLITQTSCNDPIYDFGYNGQLTGKIVDASGNVVSGDIKLATFAVQATGELDEGSMVIRIKPDGTYDNDKLYPQSYQVRLVGPFIGSPTAPVAVDLTGGKVGTKDFQVTPFLTIPPPTVSGTPTSTSIVVNYSITPNGGKTPNLREIYCSTVSWPTRTTGSGTTWGGWTTKTATVTVNQGTATFTDLKPNTKYYIRVGARAGGQNLFNHSTQIIVTTPN